MAAFPDLERIAALHEAYGLFAGLDRTGITLAAKRAALQETGDASRALAGLTVGLKANIAMAGAICNAGLRHRADILAERDAHVTKQLIDVGAAVLPGLNMDAAALGGVTDNPTFGRTDNPCAPGHSSGGSSGGSAAAVACGLVDAALGTDTLGSIRIPASWCGLFGLKPTFGLIGRSGIVPLSESLDGVGPITANADLLWPLTRALAGPDPDDSASLPAPAGWAEATPDPDISGLHIGIPDAISQTPCEEAVRDALNHVAHVLEEAGAHVRPIAMPDWQTERLRKAAFLLLECEGAHAHAEALSQDGLLPDYVERYFTYGRNVAPEKLVVAMATIDAAGAAFDQAMADIDMLLTPTTPQRAILAGTPAPPSQADFTTLANAAGLPALAVPVWLPDDPLPASVQLTGPAWSEPLLIGVGLALEHRLLEPFRL